MTYHEYLRNGTWHPCTMLDPPQERSVNGTRRTIRGVIDVPTYLEGLTLYQLQATIGVKE